MFQIHNKPHYDYQGRKYSNYDLFCIINKMKIKNNKSQNRLAASAFSKFKNICNIYNEVAEYHGLELPKNWFYFREVKKIKKNKVFKIKPIGPTIAVNCRYAPTTNLSDLMSDYYMEKNLRLNAENFFMLRNAYSGNQYEHEFYSDVISGRYKISYPGIIAEKWQYET